MLDSKNRGIEYLRISVTDRCNLRCRYCIPEEGIEGIAHEEILTFEEIIKVCKSMVKLGIRKVKLTGGEPLVRKELIDIVRGIKSINGIEEVTLTTNGILLVQQLEDLIEAGITSINISLDTLDPKRFKEITRVDGLEKVLEAIHKASQSTLKSVKVNVLAAKHMNEDELINLAYLAKNEAITVRFIELMPIGLGMKMERISKEDIMKQLEETYGSLTPYKERLGNGPATYYEIENFKGKIGFISAVSECFCDECNRIRLTSNGFLKLCLHSKKGLDLKSLLRNNIEQELLTQKIQEAIKIKPEHHHFDSLEDMQLEDKMMSQIGG